MSKLNKHQIVCLTENLFSLASPAFGSVFSNRSKHTQKRLKILKIVSI